MTLTELPINISTDLVLLAQGMNPTLVKAKSPRLIEITNQAIELGSQFLHPRVVFERYKIQECTERGIRLSNGKTLEGELTKKHFVDSLEVIIAVCTIGAELDEFAANTFSKNPALAMALEGLGSASTELLGNTFCNYLESLVKEEDLFTNLPINPGMLDWPVEVGQPQIFHILDTSSIGVTLDQSGLMKPLKSLSMVVGLGNSAKQHGKSCDLCSLQKTCIYKPQITDKPDPTKI